MSDHFVSMGDEEFINEAINLVNIFEQNGLKLRILGGVAAYIKAKDNNESMNILKSLKRFGDGKPLFTDLDFIGYKKESSKISKKFEELGFNPDKVINGFFGDKRLIFYHPKGLFQIDIFLDNLEFSHSVYFSNRLELCSPTITVTDLVLEKLQIHQINHKDLVDLILVFHSHDVVNKFEREKIDGSYISKILSDDWGFWYDATSNLKKVLDLLNLEFSKGTIPKGNYEKTISRINYLLSLIDSEPKTKKWLKRSKKGIDKPWYNEVEEVTR
ncbi:MAG: hypothetical protein ACP5FQ_06890 [Thermoplasmata archaeon]